MSVDSQGKLRGSCSRCSCKEFTTIPSSVKCRCGHAPTVHTHVLVDLAPSGSSAHREKDNDTTNVYSGTTRQVVKGKTVGSTVEYPRWGKSFVTS